MALSLGLTTALLGRIFTGDQDAQTQLQQHVADVAEEEQARAGFIDVGAKIADTWYPGSGTTGRKLLGVPTTLQFDAPTEAPMWDDEQGNFGDFGLDDYGFSSDVGSGTTGDDAFTLGDAFGGVQDVVRTFQQGRGLIRSFDDPPSDGSGGPDVVLQPGGGMNGDDFGGGGMMPTAAAGPVAAGAIWLGSYLARAFGRGAASAVFTAANGMRVRLNQLWPLIRRYGPANVAGALGISIGALGTLAMQAPRTGPRRRGRGISARDVKTTRRTIRQLKRLVRMSGIRMGGGGGGGRYYRPRRRSYGYYR